MKFVYRAISTQIFYDSKNETTTISQSEIL